MKGDILAFGLVELSLALQLITKDGRSAFAVEEGPGVSLHHILDFYVPLFREKLRKPSPCYLWPRGGIEAVDRDDCRLYEK